MIKINNILLFIIGLSQPSSISSMYLNMDGISNCRDLQHMCVHKEHNKIYIYYVPDEIKLENYSTFDEDPTKNSKYNTKKMNEIINYCILHNIKTIYISPIFKYFIIKLEDILDQKKITINIKYIGMENNLNQNYLNLDETNLKAAVLTNEIKKNNKFFNEYMQNFQKPNIVNKQENQFYLNKIIELDHYLYSIFKIQTDLSSNNEDLQIKGEFYNEDFIQNLEKQSISLVIEKLENHFNDILELLRFTKNHINEFITTPKLELLYEIKNNMNRLEMQMKSSIDNPDNLVYKFCMITNSLNMIHESFNIINQKVCIQKIGWSYILSFINENQLFYEKQINKINNFKEQSKNIICNSGFLNNISIINLHELLYSIYYGQALYNELKINSNFYSDIEEQLTITQDKVVIQNKTYAEHLKSMMPKKQKKIKKLKSI